MPDAPHGRDLARVLEEHRVGILSAWIDALFALPDGHYRDYAPEEVRAWAGSALRIAADAIADEAPEPVHNQAAAVSRILREHGFTIQQVIEGLLLLGVVIEPFLRRSYGKDPAIFARALREWDAGERRLLGAVAAAFAAVMLHDVQRAQQRTALMLAAAETSGSSLDLETVFSRVAADIGAAIPADFVGVFEGDEDAEVFSYRAGHGALPNDRLREILTRPLRPAIDPLVQSVLQTPARGVQCRRAKEPFLGQTTCRALHIQAAHLIPIATPDRVQALILCIDLEKPGGSAGPTADQLEVGWGIARTVAAAVSNARLHAETARQLQVSRSLQSVNEVILGRRSGEEILAIVCAEARTLIDGTGTAIYEVVAASPDADTGWSLREIARAGRMPASFPAAITNLAPAVLEPARRAPVLVTALTATDELPVRSLIGLQLRAGAEIVGVLVLVHAKRDLTPTDVRHVRLFADQGAIALEHARMAVRQEHLALIEERQRLARDLHDAVSQSLYGLTMYAEAASRSMAAGANERVIGYLQALRETSLEALREMRLLIFDLRPTLLAEEGLRRALQSRLSAVEGRCGVHTELTVGDVEPLPQRVTESLYGIACEALNNILKHARASQVHVCLEQRGGELVLEIIDDGIGFDPEQGRRAGGLGLRSLRERAGAIGAVLKLASRPGAGTRIEVRLNRATEDCG